MESENQDGKKLTPQDIKEFQEIVERVGNHKTEGFLFLAENKGSKSVPTDNPRLNSLAVSGLIFSHGVARDTIVLNLIEGLYTTTYEQTMFLVMMREHLKNK